MHLDGPHPTSWRSILILPSHLPSGLLPSCLHAKTLYASLLSLIRATCPAHPILHLISQIIIGGEYRSYSQQFFSILHCPVTSSLLGPNIIFLSTLLPNTLPTHFAWKTCRLFVWILTPHIRSQQDFKQCSPWQITLEHRDVLPFQNIKYLYGLQINVILFTLIDKVRPPLSHILWNLQFCSSVIYRSLTKFHPGRTVNVECMDVNTFTLVSKVWLSVHRLSWNSVTSLPEFPHIILKTFITGQNFVHPLR